MFNFVFACGSTIAFDTLDEGFIFPAGYGLPVAVLVNGERVSYAAFKAVYNLDRGE